MARDKTKYVYLTIGILRHGPTHQALVADAEEHNTKQLPTVAGLRLSEYYHLRANGMLQAMKLAPDAFAEVDDVTANVSAANDAWPE